LPASSNFTNFPSASTRPYPLLAHPTAHLVVCPARSLFLHITSTSVPFQVSAQARPANAHATDNNPAIRFMEGIIPAVR
jgi:hypothetical protein